jgi:2-dehydro-3-deoxyglucarate aldolase/4-hydroxy-2-oxoheptanedioate aldolase
MAAKKSLRQRVLAGDLVRGAMVFESFSPGIGKILDNAGAEFVLFDMEHAGLEYTTLKWLNATCRGLGIAPMARVPRGEYQFLARALDIGCEGVMVPMVGTREEAEHIAQACRYPPRGRRGAGFGFAHDGYSGGDVLAKMKALDARNLVIAQIETEIGLENVEAIAATPGIDVLWVGHFDLTNFMGIPAQFDNPKFKAALQRVAKAARDNRKGLGFMPASNDWSKLARSLGYNMLAAGTDQGILQAGYKALIDGMGE